MQAMFNEAYARQYFDHGKALHEHQPGCKAGRVGVDSREYD